jgi:hypothetical protein
VFPHYDSRQMMRSHVDLQALAPPQAPRGKALPACPWATRSSGAVSETAEEQDVAIGLVADAEAEEEFEFASDSSDDDYQLPILIFLRGSMTMKLEALLLLLT